MFLDGVGLAPAAPDNPLADAPMPVLYELLGGPLTLESQCETGSLLLRGIDATLDMPGLPQSGTGQTALLAGVNAAVMHGHHQPHFPPVALRPLLAEQSIFRRVAARGGKATFANMFGPGYWEAVAARRIRRSASVIAAEGAGLRFRDEDDLRAGRAVAWDITGAAMQARGVQVPLVAPQEAGVALARLACDYDLVFFETFLPDLAGHGRVHPGPQPLEESAAPAPIDRQATIIAQIHLVMARIDAMIGGLLDAMRPLDTLLITSDHGNIESLASTTHTRNPVPLLVAGAGVSAFVHVASIMEVAGAILEVV